MNATVKEHKITFTGWVELEKKYQIIDKAHTTGDKILRKFLNENHIPYENLPTGGVAVDMSNVHPNNISEFYSICRDNTRRFDIAASKAQPYTEPETHTLGLGTVTKLDFWDSVRVLFGSRIIVESDIDMQGGKMKNSRANSTRVGKLRIENFLKKNRIGPQRFSGGEQIKITGNIHEIIN